MRRPLRCTDRNIRPVMPSNTYKPSKDSQMHRTVLNPRSTLPPTSWSHSKRQHHAGCECWDPIRAVAKQAHSYRLEPLLLPMPTLGKDPMAKTQWQRPSPSFLMVPLRTANNTSVRVIETHIAHVKIANMADWVAPTTTRQWPPTRQVSR
jgi:hypothetical protein